MPDGLNMIQNVDEYNDTINAIYQLGQFITSVNCRVQSLYASTQYLWSMRYVRNITIVYLDDVLSGVNVTAARHNCETTCVIGIPASRIFFAVPPEPSKRTLRA